MLSNPSIHRHAGLRLRTGIWLALTLTLTLPIAGAAAALEWPTQHGARSAPLAWPAQGRTGFSNLSPQLTGLAFTNPLPPERHYTNQILLNGSGVAAGDVDGDGLCDVFFAGLG